MASTQLSTTAETVPAVGRLQRILITTDFSDASRQGFPLAAEFARQFDATLVLVHVFATTLPAELSHLGIVLDQQRLAAEAGQRLRELRERELPLPLRVETVLLEGGPASEINRFAKDSKADLIITTTHGHTGLMHLWLGSTAESIVRQAPCPVLVAREQLVPLRFPGDALCRFQRLLVPTDFSEASRRALRYATAFAQRCHSELTLLHVVQPAPYPEFGYAHIPAKEAKLKRAAQEKLDEQCQELTRAGLNANSAVCHGSAFHEIVEYARAHGSDLIVIATHGRGILSHAILGSTTEKVVRRAPCPVLVAREHERDFLTE